VKAPRRTIELPDLLGLNGDGVRGPVLVGSVAAAIAVYFSVRFLSRYFTRRALTPFAVYWLVVECSHCFVSVCGEPGRRFSTTESW
jgi:undecaprenyl pyrophosphate phosphatase UppP